MSSTLPPPVAHFLAGFSPEGERVWGQVRIRRGPDGYELRHVLDRVVADGALRVVSVAELRSLAACTASGAFRPLKSAPTLRSGWRCVARGDEELETALAHLYPGTLADARAWSAGLAAPTNWSEFAAMQVGRARGLARLEPAAFRPAVEAGCSASVCLKRRLWAGPGVEPEPESGMDGNKSQLPCLEPCALFAAFARACLANADALTVPVQIAPEDLATIAAALRHALEHPPAGLREGSFSEPLNPRRLLRVLAVHEAAWHRAEALSSAPASPSTLSSDE